MKDVKKETFAVLAVVVVVIGAAAGYTIFTPKPSKSSTDYQVITRNLTLQGQAATVPCVGFNFESCPSVGSASLSPVSLITYGSTYYYAYNQTAPTGAPISGNQTTEPSATYTVWFTNSTVYCISPAHPLTNTEHQNRTCPTQPFKMTSISIPTPSVSAMNASSGLRLSLSLSANSSGLIVTVNEFNTRNAINNVTAQYHWPVEPTNFFLWVQGACGAGKGVPIGYEILQGNYGANDFNSAKPLTLEAQPQVSCPYEAPTPYYAFRPLSDVAATYQFGNIPGLAGIYNMSLNTSCHWTTSLQCWWSGVGPWSGYWTGSTWQSGAGDVIGGSCPSAASPYNCPLVLNQFPPGTYTVVAADEWGQVVVLHFNVEA